MDNTSTADGPARAFGSRVRQGWARLAGWVRTRSLRARLVAVMLVLTAVGLTVAGIATYSSLRAFLTDRVDQQIREAQGDALRAIDEARFGFGRPGRRLRPGELPKGVVAVLSEPGGGIYAIGTDQDLTDAGRTGFTERDIPGLGSYRLLYTRGEGGGQFVVGIPLGDLDSTLDRLLLIEILVGLGALAAIGGAGLWLVRVGLRPLTDIEHTASAIAAGDLSRRIDVGEPTTEVGSLGTSLNTMLGTIEASFAEREESERRLRQFVADASHELQTPLTSVRGYAELFRRGAADNPEDLANAMTRIEAEAKRMGLLVDDLLMLARLDQGRPIAHDPVDLVAVARELVGDARVVDPDRPIELVAPAPVEILGDEPRLRQVIANLLSNARTHTPAGTAVTVAVRAEGDQAVVEVADRGPGMRADHAARVFERFFRADPSRARASGGSGLGLSIVAAIAQAHGGDVQVETRPGDGATFRVVLPLRPPVDAAPPA